MFQIKKQIFFFILLILVVCACSVKKKTSAFVPQTKTHSDSAMVIVSSSNLSEDMSSLSSNNDEVMLLIYDYTDSAVVTPPILSSYFVLTKQKMSDTIYSSELYKHPRLILFLIEIDSDKKIGQIEPLVRIHAKELVAAGLTKDYALIEKYIGDEDLLGTFTLMKHEKGQTFEQEFSDIYKMDRYDYTVTLK